MSDATLSARMDAISDDPVVRAQTAAFALVTVYDFDISPLEVGRFVEVMGEQLGGSLSGVSDAFAELANAMKEDVDAASKFARRIIEAVREDEDAVNKVARAARIAAAADLALERGEEHALTIIGLALGRDVRL